MALILTIEDNVETQLILKKSLEGKYNVHTCYNLESAKQFLKTNPVSLILLDLVLPDGMGLNFFRELCIDDAIPRFPTIIITGIEDIKTKLESFKIGADDYIMKPFNPLELAARVETVLRRGPTRQIDSKLTIGSLQIDFKTQKVRLKNKNVSKDIDLTPIEFKILSLLAREIGVEVGRDALVQSVWGATSISARNIDTHVCKLRKKIETSNIEIHNKRGLGYFLTLVETPITQQMPLFTEPSTRSELLELPAFGINRKDLIKK